VKQYTKEEIIRGLRYRNNDVYKFLYSNIYPMVYKYIKENDGSDDDAKDVFQESLIILYRRACKPNFHATFSLKAFIFKTSKNLWFQKRRLTDSEFKSLSIIEERKVDYASKDDIEIKEEEILESLKVSLLQKYFRKLDLFCQRLLQLFYQGDSHETISKKMNIGYDVSRSRKKECMKRLVKMIQKDPDYRKFYGSV